MALNLYLRPNDMKVDLQIDGSSTPTIAVLERLIERVSRHVDRALNRRFFSELATVQFHGNGASEFRLADQSTEPFRGDLISVTTLKVDSTGNGTFDKTLSSGTDYWLDPANPSTINRPARKILIPQGRTTSPQISVFPLSPRRIELAGNWGYSEETSDTGLTGTLDDASDAAMTASADASSTIYQGDTLLVESEQMYVTSVATAEVSVTRGVNGTTAAAHTTKTISRIVYPPDVVGAVQNEAVRAYRDTATGYAGTLVPVEAGDMRAMYARIRAVLDPYTLFVGFV